MLAEASSVDESVQESSTAPKLLPPRRLAIISGGCCGLCVLLFSNDWVWSAVGAAILSGGIAFACEFMLSFSGVWRRRRNRRWQFATAIVVACAVAPWFWLETGEAFVRAFGVSPPQEISHLAVERHYAGGPGDTTILLRFAVDRATLQKLVSQRPFALNKEELEIYWPQGNRDARVLWDRVFGTGIIFASRAWKEVPTISAPRIYIWDRFDETAERTTVLWDAASKIAYVYYSLG